MLNRKAFTMIELVFAIVVVGILAATALARLDRDHKQDAAVQILQDIRYTQHLALMDDKTNPRNVLWQKTLWLIQFNSRNSSTTWMYYVASNRDAAGDIDTNEAAFDPVNGERLFDNNNGIQDSGESSRIFLTQNFGIKGIRFNTTDVGANSTSAAQHVAFDFMGRPHRGIFGATNTYSKVMQEDLNITFTMSDDQEFSIIIEEQTGYAYIDGQPNS